MSATTETTKWENPAKRFVAFFDIMGFKELVERNSHQDIVKKLGALKVTLNTMEEFGHYNRLKKKHDGEIKSITFSDSIIIFSKSDSAQDAEEIITTSSVLISMAIGQGIAIKGAISYGEITVDFDNSIFFGRPIIDAYLLHDQLQLYGMVFDHFSEEKINTMEIKPNIKKLFIKYKANMKTGRIMHTIVSLGFKTDHLKNLEKLYFKVSGGPRVYIDNTVEFYNSYTENK